MLPSITVWFVAISLNAQPQIESTRADTAVDRKVAEILTQLERRSDGLTDIRCRVRFVEEDKINLTERIKYGRILFLMTKPNPHFLVHFEKTEVDGILGKQEWYLFDGRWLYQAIERIRQVTKREFARPGETIDLFDIETAPFPLPFGQKKDKILKNFNVTLVAPEPGDPPQTDHLTCVPKETSRLRRRYDRLDFYVRRNLHLPTRVVVTKNNGLEINRADFPDLTEASINTGVTPKAFKKPSVWRTYEEIVEQASAPE